MGMVNLPGGGSRFRHSSRKLLDCIRLSSLLKGGPSSLVQVVAQSLSTVLPEFMREPFLRNLLRRGDGSSQLLPSASLIGRYEIALDVALMLLTKQRAVQKCVRVGWTDSSPLAGYDWIWSQYHEIPESKLIPCFLAVNRLSDAISAFVAEQEERERGTGRRMMMMMMMRLKVRRSGQPCRVLIGSPGCPSFRRAFTNTFIHLPPLAAVADP